MMAAKPAGWLISAKLHSTVAQCTFQAAAKPRPVLLTRS